MPPKPCRARFISQTWRLAAGETAQFQVESRGGRPVLIFVDPVDQSDISVTMTTADGQTVADANYSGPGSAEAAFVLPLETTRYTVTVREDKQCTVTNQCAAGAVGVRSRD